MNLPNAITVGRIAVTPLIAWLPFVESWPVRLAAFALYIAAAVTDYYDGMLARSRNLITDLGKQLDPLADKLLLLATFIPMYVLQRPGNPWVANAVRAGGVPVGADLIERGGAFPFVTPFAVVPLPLWVVLIVIGREVFMTVFRSLAARRGVVIAAIGPAKWKTGFQSTWVGSAFFWFWAATAARQHGWWDDSTWRMYAHFNGTIGVVTMTVAVVLTLYSLWLYLTRYGYVFGANARHREPGTREG